MHPLDVRATTRRATLARRLRDIVRADIISGRYGDGAIPSEPELVSLHRASRNTVREALGLLRDEGLIVRVQGAGTFAIAAKTAQQFDHTRGYQGHGVHHELLAIEYVPATGVIAQTLGVPAGTEVVLLERRTLAEGLPVGLWTTYLPRDVGDEVGARLDELGGDYVELLESVLDVSIAGSRVELESTVSDGDVATLLGMAPGRSLIVYSRALVCTDGRVVDFGFGRFRADRMTLRFWRYRDGTPMA